MKHTLAAPLILFLLAAPAWADNPVLPPPPGL